MAPSRTPEEEALYARIRTHLAELDAKFGFATRLARENNWSESFAREVIGEYAKFLFIARAGGHFISPPPLIDKAWHLHICYTEAYWQELCRDILQMDLQHTPHSLAREDSSRFAHWLQQTLASYRRFFGVPPLIWACGERSAALRHGPMLAYGAAIGAFLVGVFTNQWEVVVSLVVVLVIMGAVLAEAVRHPVRFTRRQAGFGCGGTYSGGDSTGGLFAGTDGGGGHSTSSHGGHGGHHGCGGGHGGGHGCGGGGGGHGCGGGGGGCGGGGGH